MMESTERLNHEATTLREQLYLARRQNEQLKADNEVNAKQIEEIKTDKTHLEDKIAELIENNEYISTHRQMETGNDASLGALREVIAKQAKEISAFKLRETLGELRTSKLEMALELAEQKVKAYKTREATTMDKLINSESELRRAIQERNALEQTQQVHIQ